MNQIKLKIYKEALKVACVKFVRTEDFINSKIEEICSREKFSIKGVYIKYVRGRPGGFFNFFKKHLVAQGTIELILA